MGSAETKTLRRTQDDVINAVRQWGRCSVFIGAGVSVSAGIPSAWGIIEDLGRRLLGDDQLTPEQVIAGLETLPFYDRANPYASVMDAAFPSESERARYFEELISDRAPTPAHEAVAALVGCGYGSILATTNFDRLMEQAVFKVCRHMPCVLPSDQVPEYVSPGSPRAKILKLHGDYLYGNIRNLDHELYQVKSSTAQKMRLAAAEPVMIVAGYSGGDSSVMEVLQELADDSSCFCGGIYWLHLPDKQPSGKGVESLLCATQDRGSGFVEITSSDSFFAFLQSSLVPTIAPKLPPLPERPHESPIHTTGEIRRFASERLEPPDISEFMTLIGRRNDLDFFTRSVVGLDYLLARYEEERDLPRNVASLLDGYLDLLAGGGSNAKQGKRNRRIEQAIRLGFAVGKASQWDSQFPLLRHYIAALELAEGGIDLDQADEMLADDDAYETLRCYVGLMPDATGIINSAAGAAAKDAGVCGRARPWTGSFYKAAALCGSASRVDASLVERIADWLILEFDTERWYPRDAIQALSQMGCGVISQMIAVLLDDLHDTFSREDAALVLGEIGNRKAIDAMAQAGRNASSADAKMLVYALGRTGNPRAVDALRELSDKVAPLSTTVLQKALHYVGYERDDITATGPDEELPRRPELNARSIIQRYASEAGDGSHADVLRGMVGWDSKTLLKVFGQSGWPADLRALIEAGRQLRNAGQLFEAEVLIAECLERYPGVPMCYHDLALVFSRQERPEAARRYYAVGLGLGPEHSDYYNDFAVTMRRLGDLDAARFLLVTGLGIDFGSYRLWYNLANVNIGFTRQDSTKDRAMPGGGRLLMESHSLCDLPQDNRLHEAVVCLRRVLELNPHHPGATEQLASICPITDESPDQAPTPQELFDVLHMGEWALSQNSQDVLASAALEAVDRFKTCWAQGSVENALAALQEAHGVCPESTGIIHNLAILLCHLQRYDEAVALQGKALEISPWDRDLLLNHSDFLQKAGYRREAIATVQKVIRTDPDSPLGWFVLAETYLACGKIPEAQDTVRHAARLSTPWSWVMIRGGRLIKKLGLEEALMPFSPNIAFSAPESVTLLGRSTGMKWIFRRLFGKKDQEPLPLNVIPGWKRQFDSKVQATRPAVQDRQEFLAVSGAAYSALLSGDTDKALILADEAIKMEPLRGMPWMVKAQAHALKGDVAKGIDAMDRAIEIDPSDPDKWDLKATFLLMMQRGEESRKCSQKAGELRKHAS